MRRTDLQTVDDMLHRRHDGLMIDGFGCRPNPDGMDGRELQDAIWPNRLPKPDRGRLEPDWDACADPANPG